MYKTIDLFAGAGGLSYGFEMTNKFQIVAVVEKNKDARETFISNHKKKEKIEIIKDIIGCDFVELAKKIGGIDVVIGGPPCQGFSNANRQKNHIVSMNNFLVKEYFRAVIALEPKAFVMENVSMLASATHRFYDSKIDHDIVKELGIEMKEEDLVIAQKTYDSLRVLNILQKDQNEYYKISPDLFQLLNVLYKNRNNEDKLRNYVTKNGKKIITGILAYKNAEKYNFSILNEIIDNMFDKSLKSVLKKLPDFLSFQKAFILKKELDDNQIIYTLEEKKTNKIIAKVNSYPVIEYVEKVVAEKYIQCGGIVNSLWYGVPQDRKRYIIFGIKKELLGAKEMKMPCEPSKIKLVSVNEAIMDLLKCQITEDISHATTSYIDVEELSTYAKKMRKGSKLLYNHIVPKTGTKAKERFGKLGEGQNFHDLENDLKLNYADPTRTQNSIYLRLEGKRPSGTVINVRKSMWIHPRLDRAISIREAARLQSFPDKFVFKGTKDSQYQQVGNAVPPLMAKGLAEWLYSYLSEK